MKALVFGLCGLLLAGAAIFVTLASLDDAGGAQSAGPVPRLPAEEDSPASDAVSDDASPTGRVGFIGLPPEGVEPSTPERGELAVGLGGRSTIDGGPLNDLRLYADGRLIWRKEGYFPHGANSSTTGYLEQRLTPEGIERMRSEILATGLFVRDLSLKSSSFGLIWGWARVRRDDDRLVRVDWSYPGCCNEFPAADATPEQERGLAQLNQLLRHPGAWLPASAWEDMRFSAYVPSRFAVCYGPNWRGTKSANPIPESRILALLPRSAGDVLRTKERVDHPDAASGVWTDAPEIHCSVVSTDEARVLAGSFDRAGYERDRQWVLEYGFNARAPLNRVGIVFEPIFPDGEWGCSGCG